jgi:hypothetical protein
MFDDDTCELFHDCFSGYRPEKLNIAPQRSPSAILPMAQKL